MAVAAYASVLSLLRVVGNIQHPSHLRLFPDPTQLDALREKLSFLQDFFELHSKTITEDIECTARKIPRVTYDAEILINNYVVDQLYRDLYTPNDVAGRNINSNSIHDEINRVIEEIVPINKALKTMRPTQEQQLRVLNKIAGNKPQNNDHPLTSSRGKTKPVGFDDQLEQVLEKLVGNQQNLVIVPIVGMGGIGKTTLARSLFDHPYNLHCFSLRIWFTISQDYSVKKVLQGLLKDGVIGDHEKDKEFGNENEAELITQLYQKLYGQRYLIVLDDMWSVEAWEDLRWGFPDNGKGSRVIVTTRLFDIANSLGSQNNNSYSMKFLDDDKSWDLFSEKAFEQGGLSRELEQIGREISKCCKGLPLLLVVVGGLLANSNMTVGYWQAVKKNINSFTNSANEEYCLRVAALSYHNLPIHLKPCFLYMRHFEEDSSIEVSELIKTWVVQGFVKRMAGKTLEEAARKYFEDLVGRNMFLVPKRDKTGNAKFCGIHDLLRDLSIKESNKEQLLELPKTVSVCDGISEMCVLCRERKPDLKIFHSEIIGSESTYNNGKMLVCSSCESTFPEFSRSRFVMAVKFESQNFPLLSTYRRIALYPHYSGFFFFPHNTSVLEFGNLTYRKVRGCYA